MIYKKTYISQLQRNKMPEKKTRSNLLHNDTFTSLSYMQQVSANLGRSNKFKRNNLYNIMERYNISSFSFRGSHRVIERER